MVPGVAAEASAPAGPVAIQVLNEIGEFTLLNEAWLADAFSVTPRTIRRMVARGELPAPMAMAGRTQWLAGALQTYLRGRADELAVESLTRARSLK